MATQSTSAQVKIYRGEDDGKTWTFTKQSGLTNYDEHTICLTASQSERIGDEWGMFGVQLTKAGHRVISF